MTPIIFVGGKFANGAITAAFTYLFNDAVTKWKYTWKNRTESIFEVVSPRQKMLIRYEAKNRFSGEIGILADIFVEFSNAKQGVGFSLESMRAVYGDFSLSREYSVTYRDDYVDGKLFRPVEVSRTQLNSFIETYYSGTETYGSWNVEAFTPSATYIRKHRWDSYGYSR